MRYGRGKEREGRRGERRKGKEWKETTNCRSARLKRWSFPRQMDLMLCPDAWISDMDLKDLISAQLAFSLTLSPSYLLYLSFKIELFPLCHYMLYEYKFLFDIKGTKKKDTELEYMNKNRSGNTIVTRKKWTDYFCITKLTSSEKGRRL